ncbi:hypothetical protein JK217_10375 [Gluconobacter kondonii]|uniref:alpha/beta hydrolase n=1 Tax=Gluconobacter kondonii TaxID=941463 RepID=UPI001B8B934F|nr:hypothetical protein [Gluconobacter kondonii]MBS1078152.1 hypothetical protein [Gluconobacter kondonii]
MNDLQENFAENLIILIHGTWGRSDNEECNANKWYGKNHEFRKSMESIPNTRIITPKWSGKNRHSHRTEASIKIGNEISKEINCHTKKLIIIGHSHGGNIARKSIDFINSPNFTPNQNNTSIVTISTPFLRFNTPKIEKIYPTLWYTISFMLYLTQCMEYGKLSPSIIFDISIFLLLIIPIIIFILNKIVPFLSKNSGYNPDSVDPKIAFEREIPTLVVRAPYDEAGIITSVPVALYPACNNVTNLFIEIISFLPRVLPIHSNILIGSISAATYIIIASFIDIIVYILSNKFFGIPIDLFRTYYYILYRFEIFVLFLMSLQVCSFVLIGMPLMGLKSVEIVLTSAPDARSNLRISTIISSKKRFIWTLYHSAYNDPKCTREIEEFIRYNIEIKNSYSSRKRVEDIGLAKKILMNIFYRIRC